MRNIYDIARAELQSLFYSPIAWLILIIFTLFVFAVTNSSCDSWLDVTPQAQVNAEKLFSKPKGFENALYGIYTSMTDASSYGTHMTFGLMDVLAQYYDVYQDKYHLLYEA